MKYFTPIFPFIIGCIVLILMPSLFELAIINLLGQTLLFVIVACIPAYKTGRMSYVDIAWPWGLVLIGILTYFFSSGHWLRVSIISAIYLIIGLRMGLGALKMWKIGWLNTELPRYQFQRRRWQNSGKTNVSLIMQIEILIQGLANASFLAYPAFIIGINPQTSISVFEIVGIAIWLSAFVMESIADTQKLKFLKQMKINGDKNKVCTIGLWSYTRHPNYFAEWMVWNALIIGSISSWFYYLPLQQNQFSLVLWILIGLGLIFVSRVMYATLVYFTGAKPAEYYSIQKRPDYKKYQQSTNMFFPGPHK
jgi:steroid 5-alpha reductase family enzyme